MAGQLQPLIGARSHYPQEFASTEGAIMKTHRIWLEIVLLGTAIACALALLIATLGAAASVASGDAHAQTASQATTERAYEGMITCSRCGARHSAALGKAADVCVRICVHDGGSFALVNGESTYVLDGDLNALKKFAGQRVRVVGTLSGKTITISSVGSV